MVYEAMLRHDPANADLMQRFGVALAQLGRTEEGARLMARSLELQPDRPTVYTNLARALHALGRHGDALRNCDRAIALDPSVAGAFQIRAAVLNGLGRHEDALASSGQAVRLEPDSAAAHLDLGIALQSVGRVQGALDCFDRAAALAPALGAAHHNAGMMASRLGQHERALRAFDRALALQPQAAPLHSSRGSELKELGRLPEALQSYDTALAIEPGVAATLHNRAVVLMLMERYPEALRDYDELLSGMSGNTATTADLLGRGAALVALRRHSEALEPLLRAAALAPADADVHVQLGVALMRLDRNAEAVENFDRALKIAPDQPEVVNNRAVALAALGRVRESLDGFRRVLSMNGGLPDTHINIGVVQKALGQYDKAGLHFDLALSLKPGDATAEFESGMLHLARGEFTRGWPLYEARFRAPALAIPPRHFTIPRWDGTQELTGKKLLVHAEQGLGDTIQFCRFLRRIAAPGAEIVFEVMPALRALMKNVAGASRIIGRGEFAPADYHCPLLSLPFALGTEVGTIPAEIPYLWADPERLESWAPRIAALGGLRVGVCWQGNPNVERLIWAQGRSIPLSLLAPLAGLRNVSLVSLQKGPATEQLREVSFRDRVLDLGPEFDRGPDAFLDTAAVIMALDLVISSDTSILHLAGALGRPVWALLSASPDWRWLLGRDDSPWYPTMRLFRQAGGGWGDVVRAVTAALAQADAAPGSTEPV